MCTVYLYLCYVLFYVFQICYGGTPGSENTTDNDGPAPETTSTDYDGPSTTTPKEVFGADEGCQTCWQFCDRAVYDTDLLQVQMKYGDSNLIPTNKCGTEHTVYENDNMTLSLTFSEETYVHHIRWIFKNANGTHHTTLDVHREGHEYFKVFQISQVYDGTWDLLFLLDLPTSGIHQNGTSPCEKEPGKRYSRGDCNFIFKVKSKLEAEKTSGNPGASSGNPLYGVLAGVIVIAVASAMLIWIICRKCTSDSQRRPSLMCVNLSYGRQRFPPSTYPRVYNDESYLYPEDMTSTQNDELKIESVTSQTPVTPSSTTHSSDKQRRPRLAFVNPPSAFPRVDAPNGTFPYAVSNNMTSIQNNELFAENSTSPTPRVTLNRDDAPNGTFPYAISCFAGHSPHEQATHAHSHDYTNVFDNDHYCNTTAPSCDYASPNDY